MVNSFIAKKDLDSEMTVVRNEFERGENSPLGVLFERMMATAYLWHNYGKSTIGSRADLENVPIERLQAFYRMYYQPDNATLLVAGKFDEAKTLDLVNQYFGVIPRPERTLPGFYTSEPAQDGERSVTLRRVGDVQLAVVGYHVPAGSHPDYAAISLLVADPRRRAVGPAVQGTGRDQESDQRERLRFPAARSGNRAVFRRSAAGVLARRRSRRHAAGDRRRPEEPADQRRGRAARARPC